MSGPHDLIRLHLAPRSQAASGVLDQQDPLDMNGQRQSESRQGGTIKVAPKRPSRMRGWERDRSTRRRSCWLEARWVAVGPF